MVSVNSSHRSLFQSLEVYLTHPKSPCPTESHWLFPFRTFGLVFEVSQISRSFGFLPSAIAFHFPCCESWGSKQEWPRMESQVKGPEIKRYLHRDLLAAKRLCPWLGFIVTSMRDMSLSPRKMKMRVLLPCWPCYALRDASKSSKSKSFYIQRREEIGQVGQVSGGNVG